MNYAAQDLGSANKLFGAKPAPKKTVAPAAKKPVERKPTRPATAAKPAAPKKASVNRDRSLPRSTKPITATTPNEVKPKVDIKPVEPRSATIVAGAKPAVNPEIEARFERLLDAGNQARDRRDYGTAESSYRDASKVKANDARASIGLGATFVDQLRWEDAEAAYRAALASEPNDHLIMIALSYVLTQPIAAPELGDRYAEAERLARKAIELSPRNALAHHQLGSAFESRGLIGLETENAYRKSIELATNFAPAYAHLGRLLRRKGQMTEANAAYAEAISRARDVGTIILVAEVLQSEQRYAESEKLLRSALNRDPKNPIAQLMLGRSLMTRREFAEAESLLRGSIENSRYPFQANVTLASLYSRQSKFELAEGALMQAVRYVTPFEKLPLARDIESVGDNYLKAGRSIDAERMYKQAVQLDPKNDAAAAKLAKVRRS